MCVCGEEKFQVYEDDRPCEIIESRSSFFQSREEKFLERGGGGNKMQRRKLYISRTHSRRVS